MPVIEKSSPKLGRKGIETRARILKATRELLETTSPFDLTVAAIAKAASTVPGTFYVYFDDINDLFYELNVESGECFKNLMQDNPNIFSIPENIISDVEIFIDGFNTVWEAHRHVMHYRNLEADRGNTRFQTLRATIAAPIITAFGDAVSRAKPELSKLEARAEGVVLYSAIERLAAGRHSWPANRLGPPFEELIKAQVRVVASGMGATHFKAKD